MLADGSTSSAGEILAGALKDNDRAILLGSRTFGKGSVQSIVPLNDDLGAIKLTIAYYQLPRGEDIDRREGKADWGVDPTDGYYIPGDGQDRDIKRRIRELEGLLKRKVGERAGAPEPAKAEAAKVTPESIERDELDLPLAAALRTLIARTTRGEFVKVGLTTRRASRAAQAGR